MYKQIFQIVLLITVYSTNSFSQINNPVTSLVDTNYVCIPGTKICLFVPNGFSLANKFSGIKHPQSGAFIMVSELENSLNVIDKVFTSEKFIDEGMTLIEKQKIDLGNRSGLLFKASKISGGLTFSKWILVLGDDSSSIMINGTFPAGFDSEISNNVEGCVLSSIINEDLNISPEESIGFYVDVKDTKLKFAKSFAGTLIYTVDGVFPANSSDPISFKLGSSLGRVIIDNPRDFAINRLYELPYNFEIDPEIIDISINNLSGYEIIAYGKDKKSGFNQLVYQVILFSRGSYYLMLGTAYSDYENNLSLFIDVASTFKRRIR